MIRWLAQKWQDFRAWVHHALPHLTVAGLVLVFLIVFEWHRIVIVIQSGHAGVEYKMFTGGTITDYIYPEGIHFIWPWNTMYVYDTQVQETERSLDVLTNDGLKVQVDLSIRYHPELAMVGVLQQQVGPDYANRIAVPEVESAVRTSVGGLTIEQLYGGLVRASAESRDTAGSGSAQLGSAAPIRPAQTPETADSSLAAAFQVAADQAAKRYILIDKVIIMRIVIPPFVEQAIEQKVTAEENAEAAVYRIDLSNKEIAIAQNEAQSNDIIRKSLDANLLRLKAIQAIEDLAKSPNAKIVAVPNGPNNSLPLILGSDK